MGLVVLIPPLEDPKGAQGRPTAGPGRFHPEPRPTGVCPVHRPGSIRAPRTTDDVDGIAQSGVCGSASGSEVLESAEHVEMPLWWKGESG